LSFVFQRNNDEEKKKDTKKNKVPTCMSSSKFIFKKTMKKQDMSVVITFKCCFQAPELEHSTTLHSLSAPGTFGVEWRK
jgi:hypothetical protein